MVIAFIASSIITMQAISIGGFTGGVINPSIGISVALVNSFFDGIHHIATVWIYIVGPFGGAYLANLCYDGYLHNILAPAKEEQKSIEKPLLEKSRLSSH